MKENLQAHMNPGGHEPFWDGYRELLERLGDDAFPSPAALNALLPPGVCSGSGKPLVFRPAAEIPAVDYEKHIYETGQVSTRHESWHDLFNALAWCRFPALKAAMNQCHHNELPADGSKTRSRLRDALTLLDESGAIVVSPHAELLQCLAKRDWQAAFVDQRELWRQSQVLVCGHALLEKFPAPYKSITAHVLLVEGREGMATAAMDQYLAARLLQGQLFTDPTGLSPLPLMGIPGWWPGGSQDEAFYADTQVFRAPRRPFVPPSLHPAS